MQNKKAVIYLPEAGIEPYLQTLSLCGKVLQRAGYEVYLIDCAGALPRCPMMPCCQLPFAITEERKKAVCGQCRRAAKQACTHYGFLPISVAKTIDTSIVEQCTFFMNNNEDWSSYSIDSFKVGQIAIHDLMLEAKVLGVNTLTPAQKALYGLYIQTLAAVYSSALHIVEYISPQLFLTYNPYGQCQAVMAACQRKNVRYVSVTDVHHLGANPSLLEFSRSIFVRETNERAETWPEFKHSVLSWDGVQRCFDDAVFRMYGRDPHIFSPSKQQAQHRLCNELYKNLYRRRVGVFTSSPDERVGLSICSDAWGELRKVQTVFSTQVEFLLFLKQYAQAHSDIQFIVRIHPREGLNGGSENLKTLRKTFTDSVNNFYIIWPDDNVSSYDIIEMIDACLISGSTIGLECMRLGIPVLSYERGNSYPDEDLHATAGSVEEYEIQLSKIIEFKLNFSYLKHIIRYYNCRIYAKALDVTPILSGESSTASMTCEGKILEIIERGQSVYRHNMNALKVSNHSEKEESRAIIAYIKAIVHCLFYPPVPPKRSFSRKVLEKIFPTLRNQRGVKAQYLRDFENVEFVCSCDVKQLAHFVTCSREKSHKRFLIVDGDDISYIWRGDIHVRRSRMLARLVSLKEICG